MNIVLLIALFAVLWWLVLFAVLPIGLRTQDDEHDVTLGTVSSAPGRAWHVVRSMIWATLIAIVVFVAIYFGMDVLGFSVNDVPRIIPTSI